MFKEGAAQAFLGTGLSSRFSQAGGFAP